MGMAKSGQFCSSIPMILAIVLLFSNWIVLYQYKSSSSSECLSSQEQQEDQQAITEKTRSEVLLERAENALSIIQRMRKSNQYFMTHCSKPVLVDSRPGDHTPATVGQDCEPWLVRDAVHFLHYLLVDPESMNGLEWGSGSSSFWLVTRLRTLISIENDPSWFEYVAGYFRSAGKDLIETQGTAEDGTAQKRWKGYLFQSTEKGQTQYKGSDNRFHEEYVQFGNEAQPLDSSENYFDYVSVDGRARNAGMKVAIKRIRPDGGILILDNSERERYSLGKSYVPSHWKKFEFHSDNYGSTTVWITRQK